MFQNIEISTKNNFLNRDRVYEGLMILNFSHLSCSGLQLYHGKQI